MQKEEPSRPPVGVDTSNVYDKVLKETFREALPNFITKILKIPEGAFEPVHVELQRTIEKKADFIGMLKRAGKKDTIVHLEIQAQNERLMVYREYLYSGLIFQQYPKAELIQWVLYIGKKKPNMKVFIHKEYVQYRYQLIWIKEIPYQDLLNTGIPEIMLLAILADYDNQPAEKIIKEVVDQVHKKSTSNLEFQHFVQQLHIISHLHQIQHLFEQTMESISALIKEKKDPFFKRGYKEGATWGMEKGMKKKSLDVIINLVSTSMLDDAYIAKAVGVPIEIVAKIRQQIQDNPPT